MIKFDHLRKIDNEDVIKGLETIMNSLQATRALYGECPHKKRKNACFLCPCSGTCPEAEDEEKPLWWLYQSGFSFIKLMHVIFNIKHTINTTNKLLI